jgi:hypothetical protein
MTSPHQARRRYLEVGRVLQQVNLGTASVDVDDDAAKADIHPSVLEAQHPPHAVAVVDHSAVDLVNVIRGQGLIAEGAVRGAGPGLCAV